ncbi:hypothetical protein [Mesorhizobium sp. M2D.F.Ca.ET.223.01.1.1]|nr:hypothetical protein [Mesorhizobium sp. M2D.F.Ca.ET.223.01.1.1]
MRPVLLIVAAVAAFFVWDSMANGGVYSAKLKHRWIETENFQGLVRIN